ncbi:hypothetical protein F4778DRAFT_762469 [Xylariomycetidae sp. FL2044]|nr:hypothetical protein F4778DRAFT_762469 [Xylariomycetidae sp. FL2044]
MLKILAVRLALIGAVEGLRVLSIASEQGSATEPAQSNFQTSRIDEIRISFPRNDEGNIGQIQSRFGGTYLYTMPPAHGYENGYGVISDGYRVGFEDLLPSRRFYVDSVTWSTENLTLPAGSHLYSLMSQVEFAVHAQRNEDWWWRAGTPSIVDRNATMLVDMSVDTGLGLEESYSDKFVYTAKNPKPNWSWCIDSYVLRTMYMGIYLGARTKKGGSSSTGWNMDLNLVWEECTWINQTTWAASEIPAWETCSYRRSANQTLRARESGEKSSLLY